MHFDFSEDQEKEDKRVEEKKKSDIFLNIFISSTSEERKENA